jgi:hypothetical protein
LRQSTSVHWNSSLWAIGKPLSSRTNIDNNRVLFALQSSAHQAEVRRLNQLLAALEAAAAGEPGSQQAASQDMCRHQPMVCRHAVVLLGHRTGVDYVK